MCGTHHHQNPDRHRHLKYCHDSMNSVVHRCRKNPQMPTFYSTCSYHSRLYSAHSPLYIQMTTVLESYLYGRQTAKQPKS